MEKVQEKASSLASGYTKISANLPDTTVDTLRTLASRRQVTMTEALKTAIELTDYLSSRASQGEKILVGREKQFTEIVLPGLMPR